MKAKYNTYTLQKMSFKLHTKTYYNESAPTTKLKGTMKGPEIKDKQL